jgi:hypothetical protein
MARKAAAGDAENLLRQRWLCQELECHTAYKYCYHKPPLEGEPSSKHYVMTAAHLRPWPTQ